MSLREVELILAARGIEVSYETIREWGLRIGREFAITLKRRRPRPGDKCFLDEVFLHIRGKQHYLRRAIDQNGVGLDILVRSRRIHVFSGRLGHGGRHHPDLVSNHLRWRTKRRQPFGTHRNAEGAVNEFG
ncbi:DDE-type integrase/transposase/recombinase [Azospirillum himalayense]|uniref:DDE-type integrase/transposase/recombinase n=1 Tax=Azospirillum himalayense TaxID=654847 RepID=A0ABW0GBM6_9PROT